MITIQLKEDAAKRETYGMLYESVETVDVPEYTRSHPMVVQVWKHADCTGGRGTHVLKTIPVVISNQTIERRPHLGDLQYGQTVRLRLPSGEILGAYTVTKQRYDGPTLRPTFDH